MSRADDVRAEDYFRAASAASVGSTTYGPLVSLAGIQSWSCTVFTNDGAKVTVGFQFGDYSNRTRLLLPDNINNMMVTEVTRTLTGTAGTPAAARDARFGDGTCAANVMRVIFTPTTGSVGTLWAALTLRGA